MSMNESDVVAAKINLDTSKILPAFKVIDEGVRGNAESFKLLNSELAIAEKSYEAIAATMEKMNTKAATAKSGNTFIADSTGAVRNLQQAIRDMQLQAKEGEISLTGLVSGLNGLRATYAEALNPASNPMGSAKNDFDIRNALIQAQNDLSKFQDFELTSERRIATQFADIDAQNAKVSLQTKMAADKDYISFWTNTLKEQETAQEESITNQMRQIKTFYDLKLTTATQSLADLEKLMNEETAYFVENQDKRMQALKLSYSLEKDMAAQQNASSKWSAVGTGSMNHGSSVGTIDMAKMMVEFSAINEVMGNLQKGFVDIDKGAAGLKQVFADDTQTQKQLNDVTNEFIGIAKQYGVANTEVIDAGKLWGRQYKDVATAITLTRNATILATVDNLSMADSNRAVEATMNAMEMKVTDATSAYAASMKIVDSWSALAHEASVSANDLAQGVERSAGAAHQAGLNIDQLNALIAVGVRNTGLEGSNIGNAVKTFLTNISVMTPKVQNAFEKLGVSVTTAGADGVKSMKPVWQLINELGVAAKNATTADSEWFKAISGGVLQVSKFEAIIKDQPQIMKVYTESLNSNGKAQQLVQDQLHTVHAELMRLSDTIQQMAHDAESNGLGDVFKVLVVGVTDLINGFSQMPKWFDITVAGFAGVAVGVRIFSGVVGGLKNIMGSLQLVWKSSQVLLGLETVATTNATAALAAKTVATGAAAVADGEQAVAAGVATVALEGETVAAKTATAAFTALDIVTGGIALVIGLAVTALGISAIAMGKNKTKSDALTQSTQEMNNQMAQTVLAATNSGAQLVQNINSLQDIKQAYDNASKALAVSKVGTEEHTKAEAAMSEAKRELIGLVGTQQADQMIASSNIVTAINTEILAITNLKIAQDQGTIDSLVQEETKTQTVITETNKRIKAFQDEADKQQALSDKIIANFASAESLIPSSSKADPNAPGGSVYVGPNNPNAKFAAGNQAAADKTKKDNEKNLAELDQQNQQIQTLKNQLAQEKSMLTTLTADPNAKFGTLIAADAPSAGSKGGGGGGTPKTPEQQRKDTYDAALATAKFNADFLNQSVAQQIAALKQISIAHKQHLSEDISDQRTMQLDIKKLNEDAVTKAKASDTAKLDSSEKFIAHQKALGQMSEQDEYDALVRVQARYKEGTDERKKLDEEVYAAKKALMAREVKDMDDMVSKEKKALNDAQTAEIKAINDKKKIFDYDNEDSIRKLTEDQKAVDVANTNADYATTLATNQARDNVLKSAVGPDGIKERKDLEAKMAKDAIDQARTLAKQDTDLQVQKLQDDKTAKDRDYDKQVEDVNTNYANLLKAFDSFKDDSTGRAELLKQMQITKDTEKNTTILQNLDTFISQYQTKMAAIANPTQQSDLQTYNSNIDKYNTGNAADKSAAHAENNAIRLKYGITDTGKLQHFKDGGTVQGSRGSAVPVIAHGGEMFINPSQQSNLFKLLNFSMPQFSMPGLDSGRSSSTQITNHWTITSGDINMHDDADITTFFNERNNFVKRTQAVSGVKQR